MIIFCFGQFVLHNAVMSLNMHSSCEQIDVQENIAQKDDGCVDLDTKKCCSEKKDIAKSKNCNDDCGCKCCKNLTSNTFMDISKFSIWKSLSIFKPKNIYPSKDLLTFDFRYETFHPPKNDFI